MEQFEYQLASLVTVITRDGFENERGNLIESLEKIIKCNPEKADLIWENFENSCNKINVVIDDNFCKHMKNYMNYIKENYE